jgi:hypothetical protein
MKYAKILTVAISTEISGGKLTETNREAVKVIAF